jgi:hypothetical protein
VGREEVNEFVVKEIGDSQDRLKINPNTFLKDPNIMSEKNLIPDLPPGKAEHTKLKRANPLKFKLKTYLKEEGDDDHEILFPEKAEINGDTD